MQKGREEGLILSAQIFKAIQCNPGFTATQIAEMVGCNPNDVESVKKAFGL